MRRGNINGVWQIVAHPKAEPLTVDEVMDHCRIPDADDKTTAREKVYLRSLIRASRELTEGLCGISIMPQQWKLVLDQFPDNYDQEICLPRSPVTGVDSFKYRDIDDKQQTLAATDYQLDSVALPARVRPAWNKYWPATSSNDLAAIEIAYSAGYTTAEAMARENVPEQLRLAMLLLIGHWYEHRETAILGSVPREIPLAYGTLINEHRVPNADWNRIEGGVFYGTWIQR